MKITTKVQLAIAIILLVLVAFSCAPSLRDCSQFGEQHHYQRHHGK